MKFLDNLRNSNSKSSKKKKVEINPTLPDSIGDLYKTPKTENESFDTISEAKKILETSLYGDMRKRLKDVLATQSSPLDTKNLFDDIDDDKITKSIPVAEAVIETNKKSGLDVSKYPYLKDGLTMMYAAGEAGNSREMQKAKKAAYMPLTGNIGDLKDITENAVLKGKSLAEPMKTETWIYTPGKDGDAGMTLYSEKVGARDGEDIVKQISKTNKVSSKSISTQDADAVYNRARSGAYSITAEDRAILTGMMNDSSTPITKKKEIQSILSRESAKIKPLDEETRKNSKPVERDEAEEKKTFEDKVTSVVNDAVSTIKEIVNDVAYPSKILGNVQNINTVANYVIENDKTIRDVLNSISNNNPDANGNPEENYKINKALDLQSTGAMSGKFINDQELLADYKFGLRDVEYGGCGVISMYNVMQGLGKDVDFADVIHESENSALLKGNFGMSPDGVKAYLRKNGFEVTNDWLGVDGNYDPSGSDAVIHLYFRDDYSAHYVAGIYVGNGKYRFYNSQSEITTPMTWDEYYEKNIGENVKYSCALKERKKE